MSSPTGCRRILAAAFAAASVVGSTPAVAAAAGPDVRLQVNDLSRSTQTSVTLGEPGTTLPHRAADAQAPTGLDLIDCGSGPGILPADSFGAALEQIDNGWSYEPGSGFNNVIRIVGANNGAGYEASSLGFGDTATDPSWHAWIDDATAKHYVNFGYELAGAFCRPLADGDEVTLQASQRRVPENDTYGLPTTPHAVVENVPQTVEPGETFGATLNTYVPANGWGAFESDPLGQPAIDGQSYGMTLDYGTPVPVGADRKVSFTVPEAAGGTIELQGFAGTTGTLPTAAGNSASSLPRSICVYRDFPDSPCVASVAAETPSFGVQPRETLGAARSIVVTPAKGQATVTGAQITGDAVDDYLITSSTCTGDGAELDSGADKACTIKVRFSPSVVGPRAASLVIATTASNGTLTVPLSGEGGAAAGGTPGQDGENGAQGPKGDPGTPGVPGAAGGQGSTGPTGPAGAPGAPGPAGRNGTNGKDGRNAVCQVKRRKGRDRITCRLAKPKAGSSTKARLTRDGRTVARGTLRSLRATRSIRRGTYTLRYRSHGRRVVRAVRVG